MVSSPPHAQALVICMVLSLVSAQQYLNSNEDERIPPQQVPIRGYAADAPSEKNKTGLGKDATINLYPPSLVQMRMDAGFSCREKDYNTITLATETCLTGNYYPSKNIKILEDPVCDDGSAPFLTYYQQSGCEGKAHYTTDLAKNSLAQSCLWSGYAPEEWSMIFRCRSERASAEGASTYQTATPPPPPPTLPHTGLSTKADSPSTIHVEKSSDALVLSHLSPGCTGYTIGGNKPYNLKADKQCATTPGYGIQIQKPAVCANGTRAKWARYEDDKCGHGHFPAKYGLMDIRDADIGKCLSTGPVSSPTKVRSIAFWCDGLKPQDRKSEDKEDEPKKQKPKAAAGSVSESACMVGKAPFFNHPKTDTCVNLRTSKMKIYSSGVCDNGTKALMATYSGKNCMRSPAKLWDLGPEEMQRCLPFDAVGSFAFWCTGDVVVPQPVLTHKKLTAQQEPKQTWKRNVTISMITMVVGGIMCLVIYALYMQFGSKIKVNCFTYPSMLNTSANDLVQSLFSREGGISL
jgi:hypothetical protein